MMDSSNNGKSEFTTPPPAYASQEEPDLPHFDKPSSPKYISNIQRPLISEKESESGKAKSQTVDIPENSTNNFQNEIFEKPAKFRVYPTEAAAPVQESVQFKDGAPLTAKPTDQTTEQQQHRVPTVFSASNSQHMQGQQPNMTSQQGPSFPTYVPRFDGMYRHCGIPVMTEKEYVAGTLTHCTACCLCWFTGCCCIAYCIDSLKDVEHYCPHCNNLIGCDHKDVC